MPIIKSFLPLLCALSVTVRGIIIPRASNDSTTTSISDSTNSENGKSSSTSSSSGYSSRASASYTSYSSSYGTKTSSVKSYASATSSSEQGSTVVANTTTVVASGTDDLGWVPSGLPTPTTLATTNADQITPTVTSPVGSHSFSAVNFGGNYSSDQLEDFWDTWVGSVQSPPFQSTPLPPNPYPLPEDPPPLFPSYISPSPENILPNYTFPEGFLFGWATAAQQWEGAVKDDGKGPTIWDWASRFPGFIADNTTSDVGDLGYYLYKEDIARLAALGGNAYSFSLFWTRILPFASKDSPVNELGIQHYQDVIDYAWSVGVEPVVTLFHWDTPLALQLEYGGFASERIIDDYVNYAETVFKAYNGSVHRWFTFNEPVVFCSQGAYPINTTFPNSLNSTVYPYTCSYHLVLAHAKAVQRFRELNIVGEIAFKSDNFIGIPWREDNQDDLTAVERHAAYQIGIFAEPIYVTGDWPQLIKDDLPPEILPRFNKSQIEMIKCTADFFAIDGYRDGYVTVPSNGFEACIANISDPLWPVCNQVNFYESTPYAWGLADFADPRVPWLQDTWRFLRPFLADLLRRYPTNGGIYLSEFGWAEPYENLLDYKYIITTDTKRELYYLSYLGEVLKAINDDGVPVKGTFAWSLVDNSSGIMDSQLGSVYNTLIIIARHLNELSNDRLLQ